MQVRIYRRKGESPYWQAQAYVGGRRYRFRCETADKSIAREYARQRVEELKARHNAHLFALQLLCSAMLLCGVRVACGFGLVFGLEIHEVLFGQLRCGFATDQVVRLSLFGSDELGVSGRMCNRRRFGFHRCLRVGIGHGHCE
jgi:hypothetical protein